jgi:drug/metabolite transporter (DMT)-like permease
MLLALASIWGASFMFIKVGVRELEPSTLIAVRIGLGALALIPIALVLHGARETVTRIRSALGPLAVMGLVNSAIPFWLISWGEQRVDSGLTAILQACAPLFTALLALAVDRKQVVSGLRLAGFFVGFAGVAVLVGSPGEGSDPVRALAVVASGFLYALAVLYGGRKFGGLPPLIVATGAMTTATLFTLPLGIAQAPDHVPGWKVIASMLALGIGGTAFAYLLYYGLIAGAGASRAILITYLVPPVALFYGALILDEPVTLWALLGLALVLAGVALGTGGMRLASRRAPVPASLGE